MDIKKFDWTLFLELLENKEIIPVVGADIIRVMHQNSFISLNEFLSIQLSEKQELTGEYKNLAELFESNHANRRLITYIRTILKSLTPEHIDTSYLVKLSKISNFSVFINTSYDGILTEVLEKVRPDDFSDFKSIDYSLTGADVAKEIITGTTPLIFNLFGNIKTGEFAKSEEELLEYCFNYALDKNMQFKLAGAFKNRHPLFIGTNYPFWLQLFIIRMITSEPFSKSDVIKFVAENKTNDTAKLRTFLEKYNTEFFISETDESMNVYEFIDKIYAIWSENNANKIQKLYKGSVFLSFNSGDRQLAHEVWKTLTERGVTTFYDEEIMKSGSVYDKKIIKQIKSCTLFIPFISEHSISDHSRYVYAIEWKAAEARRMFLEEDSTDSFIKPYIVDNTNFLDVRIPETFRKLTIAKIYETNMVEDIISFLEPINANN